MPNFGVFLLCIIFIEKNKEHMEYFSQKLFLVEEIDGYNSFPTSY